MKSTIRPLLAVSALVLAFAAGAPRSAGACTEQCVRVDPSHPFCRVCTDVGTYTAKDVSVTTVYFTQDNDAQRAAAVALVDQFPQLHGPVPRFFDVPGQPAPGLVVVTTGDWKP